VQTKTFSQQLDETDKLTEDSRRKKKNVFYNIEFNINRKMKWDQNENMPSLLLQKGQITVRNSCYEKDKSIIIPSLCSNSSTKPEHQSFKGFSLSCWMLWNFGHMGKKERDYYRRKTKLLITLILLSGA